MNLLVRRLHAAPRRGEQLSGWIRFILIHHAGYFAGSGACTETLSSLYQIIDSRLASYQSLIALHGRLDLIVNTVRCASNFEEEIAHKGALLTADINDDGDIEVQDAAAALALESDDEEEYLEGESGDNSFDDMEED
jgi:U3 small nucleolar RNA-associated protein 5